MPIDLGDDEAAAYAGNEAPASFTDFLGAAAFRCAAAATRLGVFEALRDGPLSAAALADAVHANERGTALLADALVTFGYLSGDATGYANTPLTAKWLVDSPYATVERFWQRVIFELWDDLELSVRSGAPAVDFYTWLRDRPETAAQFQSMLDKQAGALAPELADLIPVPDGPARLLDLGGGHGRYATALCAAHPELTATVVDFPEALGPGGDRVTMAPGDYRTDDLGSGHDVVLLFNVLHGHTEQRNRELLDRVVMAMAPTATVAVLEHDTDAPDRSDVAFLRAFSVNLFHGQGGAVYPVATVRRWLADAGLRDQRVTQLRRSPTQHLITAARGT